MRSNKLRGMLVALTGFAFVACGGGDSGTTPTTGGNGGGNGGGGGTPPNRTILASPSYSADIQEIFGRKGCTASGCHGTAPQAGLDLRSSVSFANLVNASATQGSGLIRVIPNDAVNSYLMVKVEGRQAEGSTMPIGVAALDNIDLTNLRNWINNGAPNN